MLLAQSEIGEVAEVAEGAGGSSSMAHKHNPIAAVSARAAAMQAPGLVATLLDGGRRPRAASGRPAPGTPSGRPLDRCCG